MIFGIFRRNSGREAMDALFVRIAQASRAPELYAAGHVPDTAEGRFESLALHVILVLRRLRRLPPPAADVAQDLVDTTFSQLDSALREMGVGDIGVPKRMKVLAAAFYGRAASYDKALAAEGDEALAAVLARDVLDGVGDAGALAAYMREAEKGLAARDLDAILHSGTLFPELPRFWGRADDEADG